MVTRNMLADGQNVDGRNSHDQRRDEHCLDDHQPSITPSNVQPSDTQPLNTRQLNQLDQQLDQRQQRFIQQQSVHQQRNDHIVQPETDTPASSSFPRRIGIIGLGLIGGSLALRLVRAGCTVLAWNHTPRPYEAARKNGIICMSTLEDVAAAEPDVLVLCNPLKAMPSILAQLAPVISQSTTLTDVGSVKGMIREQVEAAGLGDVYVGAHPMAGNEHSGWAAADPSLYDGALWAITVDENTDYERFRAVAGMIVEVVHNRIIVIDDDTHDNAAAMISHMPHVVATALINELVSHDDRDVAVALAAGSWRDMTRVALTDPDRTRAMVEEDAQNVEELLRHMAARLDDMATALHDWRTLPSDDQGHKAAHDEILRFFAQGQPFRDYKAKAQSRSQSLSATNAASATTAKDEAKKTAETDMSMNSGDCLTEHSEGDIRLVLNDEWRQTLQESACRGEHIIRFDGKDVAIARTLSHLA